MPYICLRWRALAMLGALLLVIFLWPLTCASMPTTIHNLTMTTTETTTIITNYNNLTTNIIKSDSIINKKTLLTRSSNVTKITGADHFLNIIDMSKKDTNPGNRRGGGVGINRRLIKPRPSPAGIATVTPEDIRRFWSLRQQRNSASSGSQISVTTPITIVVQPTNSDNKSNLDKKSESEKFNGKNLSSKQQQQNELKINYPNPSDRGVFNVDDSSINSIVDSKNNKNKLSDPSNFNINNNNNKNNNSNLVNSKKLVVYPNITRTRNIFSDDQIVLDRTVINLTENPQLPVMTTTTPAPSIFEGITNDPLLNYQSPAVRHWRRNMSRLRSARTDRSVHATDVKEDRKRRRNRQSNGPLDRNERSANLSHITGTTRKIQLYIKNRYIQLLPDGTVNGTQDELSDYTILQRTTVDIGQVKIQGVATCLFLCMDSCGTVYGSKEFNEDCVFNEAMEQHYYNTYSSTYHSNTRRKLYLALNRLGQPRKVQIPATRPLGKLATYTKSLTQTVTHERVESLITRLFGPTYIRHGLKQLCESTKSLNALTSKSMKQKPRCNLHKAKPAAIQQQQHQRRKHKRRCRPDENDNDQCVRPNHHNTQHLGATGQTRRKNPILNRNPNQKCATNEGGNCKKKIMRKNPNQNQNPTPKYEQPQSGGGQTVTTNSNNNNNNAKKMRAKPNQTRKHNYRTTTTTQRPTTIASTYFLSSTTHEDEDMYSDDAFVSSSTEMHDEEEWEDPNAPSFVAHSSISQFIDDDGDGDDHEFDARKKKK